VVTTPAAGTGAVDVVVTNPDGGTATRSGGFTYVPPAPAISSVTPTSGPTTGGNTVAVAGSNFTGATQVRFGNTNATNFTVNSDSQITATAPARSAGATDVRVTTAGGTSNTSSVTTYTYVAPPAVTSLSPTSGPAAGGTSVTINGSNFSGATAVQFGTLAATSFNVTSGTRIVAVAPAQAAGRIDIRVTTSYGTSNVVIADRFTYQ
jgi:hypothetical protein